MTAQQQGPTRNASRPWFVLLFLGAAVLNVVLAVVFWDADKLVIAILFAAVANLGCGLALLIIPAPEDLLLDTAATLDDDDPEPEQLAPETG